MHVIVISRPNLYAMISKTIQGEIATLCDDLTIGT